MVFLGQGKNSRITTDFKGKHILSLNQFTPTAIKKLFATTRWIIRRLKHKRDINILKGSVSTLLFFEPSTRTFMSFSSAIKKLGGSTIEMLNPLETSSFAKNESLSDSMITMGTYTDLIIVRHPKKGFLAEAASVSPVPVISAGDGDGEHPTQTLYDLFTIQEKFGKLSGLKTLFAGDILHSRSMHSLLKGLSLYDKNTVYLLSPKELRISNELKKELKGKIKIIEIKKSDEIPTDCHFWYSNRLQKERIKSNTMNVIKNYPVITKELLKKHGNKKMIVLDPLPRVGNIDTDVDDDPRAYYLKNQLINGFYVRAALTGLVMGRI